MLKLHLDENVDHAIAHGLRLRGIDVTTASDARESVVTTQTAGTVHGDVIRLDSAPPLPAGCRVELTIRSLEPDHRKRPKVGQMIGPPVQVPDEALAPLTNEELREWGL